MTQHSSSVEAVGSSMFESLASNFPVACASDEFFYFPQIRLSKPEWNTWDNFSPGKVSEFVCQLSAWEEKLDLMGAYQHDLEEQIDITILKKIARTLREQLSEVRIWESQPTFYLSLVSIGLAEALESEDPAAKHDRAKSLPAFLEQAGNNLIGVPVLFRDIGLEMVSDTRNYLASLQQTLPELKNAFIALDRFDEVLRNVQTRKDFLLPRDIVERIVRFHINCDMDIQEVNQTLDHEIHEMKKILALEAGKLVPVKKRYKRSELLWDKALKSIPIPAVGKEGLIGLYTREVENLAQHCMDNRLVTSSLVSTCPVRVAPMPPFLSAIRSAASYSISPQYPPAGGVFYINNAIMPDEAQQAVHHDYRMLAAHETYPGHHLLDASRWCLDKPTRRTFEQPVFYEGWACFAEELMRLTGYFADPGDRLLLAKRRLWRAIRGKVDLGLQTGTLDVKTSARCLTEIGMSMKQALSSVRKYPLNAGYQLCYTVGLRRFLDLFDRYGRDDLHKFVHIVLSRGEIHFQDLEKILKQSDG
jgi:uncharacterized protein (DUF885 family)